MIEQPESNPSEVLTDEEKSAVSAGLKSEETEREVSLEEALEFVRLRRNISE